MNRIHERYTSDDDDDGVHCSLSLSMSSTHTKTQHNNKIGRETLTDAALQLG